MKVIGLDLPERLSVCLQSQKDLLDCQCFQGMSPLAVTLGFHHTPVLSVVDTSLWRGGDFSVIFTI